MGERPERPLGARRLVENPGKVRPEVQVFQTPCDNIMSMQKSAWFLFTMDQMYVGVGGRGKATLD